MSGGDTKQRDGLSRKRKLKVTDDDDDCNVAYTQLETWTTREVKLERRAALDPSKTHASAFASLRSSILHTNQVKPTAKTIFPPDSIAAQLAMNSENDLFPFTYDHVADVYDLELREIETQFNGTVTQNCIKDIASMIQRVATFGRTLNKSKQRKSYYRTMKYLYNWIRRCNKPLENRNLAMLNTYMLHLNRYRDMSPQFFDYIRECNNVTENAVFRDPDSISNVAPIMQVALHTINATPSITLAQSMYHVFGNEYAFSEVCQFFMQSVDAESDELYVERTQYILHRYQSLGDGQATEILSNICTTEMLLFPLLLRRKNIPETIHKLCCVGTNTPLICNGVTVAANDLYDQMYQRVNVMTLVFEFITKKVSSDLGLTERDLFECPLVIVTELMKSSDVLELANMLQWRYNGINYMDPNSDVMISVCSPTATIVNYVYNEFLSLLSAARLRHGINLNIAQVKFGDDVASKGGTSRGKKKKPSLHDHGLDNSTMLLLKTSLTNMFASLGAKCRSHVLGNAAEIINREAANGGGSGGGGGGGGNARSSSTVSSETTDKFVRYTDKETNHHIVLNLILNRYELATPVLAPTLQIDYGDFNAPRQFRFNEQPDKDLNAFVHNTFDCAGEYLSAAASRDTMNHYLYSRVVPERRTLQPTEASVFSTTTTTTMNYAKRVRSSEIADEIRSRSTENGVSIDNSALDDNDKFIRSRNQRNFRRFVVEVSDLTVRLPSQLNHREVSHILMSHSSAREFTIIALNMLRVFGPRRMLGSDAAHRMIIILTSTSNDTANTNNHYLLYAPLTCQSTLDVTDTAAASSSIVGGSGGRVKRIVRDVFVTSEAYLRRHGKRGGCLATTGGVDGDANSNDAWETRRANIDDADTELAMTDMSGHEYAQRYAREHDLVFSPYALDMIANAYNMSKSTGYGSGCDGGGINNNGSCEPRDDIDIIMSDLIRAQRRLTRENLMMRQQQQEEEDQDVATKLSHGGGIRDELVDIIPATAATDFIVTPPDDAFFTQFPREDGSTRIAVVGSMRNFLSSWRLAEFAREHADDEELRDWLLGKRNDAERETLANIAATYLFMLTRERERRRKFGGGGNSSSSSNDGDDGGGVGADECDETRFNLFARLSNPRFTVLDECIGALNTEYPELYIYSLNTNDLATGLTKYAQSRQPRFQMIDENIAFSVCLSVVCLHIFTNGDKEVMMFFVQFLTSIRFPGQFLKSALVLLGSNSGKTVWLAKVVRYIYSCMLTGTLSNATLRGGMRDEVNTDLQSMMQAHVCQVDEPERMNAELFKNIVSDTKMKTRRFHSQTPQYQCSLAKLVLTMKDVMSMRSDAGVITRLKYCVQMTHEYKTLHSKTFDCANDFTSTKATPSVAYQQATKCFPQGINFAMARIGTFLTIEHYGLDACTYNDTYYLLRDVLATKFALQKRKQRKWWREDRSLPVVQSILNKISAKLERLMILHRMLAYKLEDKFTTRRQQLLKLDERAYDPITDSERLLRARKIFGEHERCSLKIPIVIDYLPKKMERDVNRLYASIDYFELLQQKYRCVHDPTVTINDRDLTQFLRKFLDESGCSLHGGFKKILDSLMIRVKVTFVYKFNHHIKFQLLDEDMQLPSSSSK